MYTVIFLQNLRSPQAARDPDQPTSFPHLDMNK